ncbi:hypothetical protein Ga0100231_024155 [Opitutaceae bacterium TAV4]|nr:hypothetical protein Ga0100231_024155 [Opitutaceae bacterium TAV4]RRK00805.1 hypothetical protein Ga0100230_023730 [Opitutaceae bacterium TAV3]
MAKTLAALVALLQAIPALAGLVDKFAEAWKTAQAAKRKAAKDTAVDNAVPAPRLPAISGHYRVTLDNGEVHTLRWDERANHWYSLEDGQEGATIGTIGYCLDIGFPDQAARRIVSWEVAS